jgi:hypothetical protein
MPSKEATLVVVVVIAASLDPVCTRPRRVDRNQAERPIRRDSGV